MDQKSKYLTDSIFKKLKKYNAKKIFLEKENFDEFIFSLFKDNESKE